MQFIEGGQVVTLMEVIFDFVHDERSNNTVGFGAARLLVVIFVVDPEDLVPSPKVGPLKIQGFVLEPVGCPPDGLLHRFVGENVVNDRLLRPLGREALPRQGDEFSILGLGMVKNDKGEDDEGDDDCDQFFHF